MNLELESRTSIQFAEDRTKFAEERTKLAMDRTLMAVDRSLMAWIRTALSMISFGFAIYKILQGFESNASLKGLKADYSPETIGLFLTGLGTVSMMVGTIEYWQRLREMREYQTVKTFRPSLVIAMVMSITGLFFFISIITKFL